MKNENSNDNNKAIKEDELYLDDNNTLQTKEEHEAAKAVNDSNEKATPLMWDDTPTLADKITVNPANEDILTPVVDNDDTSGDSDE